MPYVYDANGRHFIDGSRGPKDLPPRTPMREARCHGVLASLGPFGADDYLARPLYPTGSPESVAFWQGWNDSKREWDAVMGEYSEDAPDTRDEAFGL